jgi:hypothetical protein
MDKFTQAYITAMLWAECDDDGPLDYNYSVEDIDPLSLELIIDDCQRFQAENQVDINTYPDREYTGDELAGHDFWLTRNGHGTGFWDRDYLTEEVRNRLTKSATKFRPLNPYAHNGKVHL